MASPQQKPVILFVHGAWHTPGHYNPLIRALQRAGYPVVAPTLATAGPCDSIIGKGVPDDIARIDEVVGTQIESGKEVILVAHSYGGLPGTQYVKGRTTEERKARGLAGGFVAAVYISAYAPPLAGDVLYNHDPHTDFFEMEKGIAIPNRKAISRLYLADLPGDNEPNLTTRETLFNLLGGHSGLAFAAEAAVGACELPVPKTYFVCTRDDCFALVSQRKMAEGMGAHIIELEAGHSPFLAEAHVERLVKGIAAATIAAAGM